MEQTLELLQTIVFITFVVTPLIFLMAYIKESTRWSTNECLMFLVIFLITFMGCIALLYYMNASLEIYRELSR